MNEEFVSRTITQKSEDDIKEKIWKRFNKFFLEIKKFVRKNKKFENKSRTNEQFQSSHKVNDKSKSLSKMNSRSMSSSKRTRRIEIIESIKQESRKETTETYSSTNKIIAQKLKLNITEQRSTRIFISIKSSFFSSVIDKISKTTLLNQSIILISQTLQISSIESISSTKLKNSTIKKRNMKEESYIKTFWKKKTNEKISKNIWKI